jgi:hypothetical protein
LVHKEHKVQQEVKVMREQLVILVHKGQSVHKVV